jgi:hypothetical protein
MSPCTSGGGSSFADFASLRSAFLESVFVDSPVLADSPAGAASVGFRQPDNKQSAQSNAATLEKAEK